MALVLLVGSSAALAGIGSGLSAHYPFEGNANDVSGSGNHGTEVGGPTYVAGQNGDALSLDGVNDLVQLPASLMQTDFSVAFWVRTTVIAPNGSNWFEGLGLVDGEVCGSPAGGDVGIALIDGGRVIFEAVKGTASVNDGSFHAVAVTRTGTSIAIFVDGAGDASGTLSSSGAITGMPWIGVGNNPCDAGQNRRWFPGEIDELRFYDRVLTTAEIEVLAGIRNAPALPFPGGVALVLSMMSLGIIRLARRRRWPG